MDDTPCHFARSQRSQSATSTLPYLNIKSNTRHRSSLPNALLSAANSDTSSTPQSSRSSEINLSHRDGFHFRTSVISYSGSSQPVSHGTTPYHRTYLSSGTSQHHLQLHKPVSTSSLSSSSSSMGAKNLCADRRHSLNVITSSDLSCSGDHEMPEFESSRAEGVENELNTFSEEPRQEAGLLIRDRNMYHSIASKCASNQFDNVADKNDIFRVDSPNRQNVAPPTRLHENQNYALNMSKNNPTSPSASVESSMDEEMLGSPSTPPGPNIFSSTTFADYQKDSTSKASLAISGNVSISIDHLSSQSLQDLRLSNVSSVSIASSASDESNTSDFAPISCNIPSNSKNSLKKQESSNGNNSPLLAGPFAGPSDSADSNVNSGAAKSTISSSDPLSGGNCTSINLNTGYSRQQLLSGPCPICGDRISGFHYGLFSCESCKGFFKRTVQNKKNYVCIRGSNCPITITTRKKCPACRFEKCLKMGMKLEAIREDRTRGGRSTYQCAYTLSPAAIGAGLFPNLSRHALEPLGVIRQNRIDSHDVPKNSGLRSMDLASIGTDSYSPYADDIPLNFTIKKEGKELQKSSEEAIAQPDDPMVSPRISGLIKEILSVEHLWHQDMKEKSKRLDEHPQSNSEAGLSPTYSYPPDFSKSFENNFCYIADHHLYKLVKWCRSLPLFQEISIDDKVALLHNSWVELLLFSCCYRSISTPGHVRISANRGVSVEEARIIGIDNVIERIINLTDHLRRLQLDQCEYVCMKVIILMTPDALGLQEIEKVDILQRQIAEALQKYSIVNYPQQPLKFGELLLRLPELERVCQVARETLALKQAEQDMKGFNILMQLFRDDH